MYSTKVQKVGNSLCIVIPKNYAKSVGFERGDDVKLGIVTDDMRVGVLVYKEREIVYT